MKLIHIIIITLLSTSFFYAQDIANARTQAIGASVTISGIVTNGDELGPVRYIEDATAGIAVYDPTNLTGVDRGDSITVTGNLIDYNGLLEIQPVSNFTNHGNGYTITPQLITPLQIDENTEAELVEIQNTIIDNGGSNFTQGLHNFSSNGESGILYLRSGHPLIGQIIPTGPITIIGISSQYTFTGSGGYQLLPRDEDDLVLGSGINITSALQQTNLNNTSFDLSWTTDLIGSSSLIYGIDENNLIDTINISGSNTSHTVNLSGLTAGTIYYAQGFSVNGTDTAFTAIGVFATVSNSSGLVRAYFNKSVDNSVAIIEDAQNIGVTMNDTIKAYIDKAQHTLDIAIYNHSDALITTAINDAYDRGVVVRYLSCATTSSLAIGNLNPSIPVFEKPNGTGIMHNKFLIVDANITDSCWLLTGSTNWTNAQLFDDPNNLIAIQDQSIARTFEIEFNEMWGSELALADSSNAAFGSSKKNNTPHQFLVNGSAMEVYFSPSDNTTDRIIDAIQTTNDELNFALLVFTNNDLRWAIEDLHNSGVTVQGVIEDINTIGSDYQYLLDAGVDVRSHLGINDDFHHKYCIVDHAIASSDPTLITGSHNWSAAAENDNDENTIIYHNQNIANQYYQEFIERFNELTASDVEESVHPSSIKKLLYISDQLGRKINPKKGSIQFLIYDDGSVEKRFLLTP